MHLRRAVTNSRNTWHDKQAKVKWTRTYVHAGTHTSIKTSTTYVHKPWHKSMCAQAAVRQLITTQPPKTHIQTSHPYHSTLTYTHIYIRTLGTVSPHPSHAALPTVSACSSSLSPKCLQVWNLPSSTSRSPRLSLHCRIATQWFPSSSHVPMIEEKDGWRIRREGSWISVINSVYNRIRFLLMCATGRMVRRQRWSCIW